LVVVVAEEALAIPVCCSLTATETGSLSDREKSAGMAVGQRRNVTREIEDRTVGEIRALSGREKGCWRSPQRRNVRFPESSPHLAKCCETSPAIPDACAGRVLSL
jgi:hypothetical protein